MKYKTGDLLKNENNNTLYTIEYIYSDNNTVILSSNYSRRTHKTSIKQLKKAYTNISYRNKLIKFIKGC